MSLAEIETSTSGNLRAEEPLLDRVLMRWGGLSRSTAQKIACALADQVTVSGTRFLTTIVIGRACGPHELGIYSLGTTFLVLVACIQESLIMVPYTIHAARRQGRARAVHAGSVLVQSVLLCALAMVALALTAAWFSAVSALRMYAPLVWVLVAVAPFATLWEFARRLAFAHLNMAAALGIDLVVAVLQIGLLLGLAARGSLSALNAYAAIGLSCAVVALAWFGASRGGFAWRRDSVSEELRRNWSFGKWVFAGQVASAVQGYAIRWVLALAWGATETGLFAACMTLVLFANPFIIGIGNMLAPSAAQAFAHGGREGVHQVIRTAAFWSAGAMALFSGLILLLGDAALGMLYGRHFADCQPIIRALAVGILAAGVEGPAYDGLWAIGRPSANFWASLVGIGVTLALAAFLVAPWGVLGAAYSWVGGAIAVTTTRYVLLFWPTTALCQEGGRP